MQNHYARDLTDEQWTLDPLIPEPSGRKDTRDRPWRPRRAVLDGILWIMRTGAPWLDLPEGYPPYQTYHRRFQHWVQLGILRGVLEALAEDLHIRGRLNVQEAYIDGSFAQAKKGARREDKARQGYEDHGSGRPLWPFCLHLH
jgi:transposase